MEVVKLNNFYGDENRFFIGIVVDNDDSDLKLGRCQVRIFGIHDNWEDIPNSDLPWAQIVLPTTEGGINGLGTNPTLEVGAQVFGFFLDGTDSQLPLILGTIPKVMIPTEFQQSSSTNSSNPVLSSSTQKDASTAQSILSTPISGLIGSSNAEKAFNFFMMNGFTTIQSAAFVGNFALISGMELSTVDNATGFGIACWKSTRRAALTYYAQEINSAETTLETQLGWVVEELKGSSSSNYATAAAKVRGSNNIDTAVSRVKQFYLEDENIDLQSAIDIANDVYERFN